MSLFVPARPLGDDERRRVAHPLRRLALLTGLVAATFAAAASPALAADTTPPERVVAVVAKVDPGSAAGNTFDVSWKATTDDVGVTSYEIYSFTTTSNGQRQLIATVDGTQTTALNLQIPADPSAGIAVVARDAAGNASQDSLLVRLNTCGAVGPPTVESPRNPAASNVTSTSATVSWDPSLVDGCFALAPTGYQVFADNGTSNPTLLASTDAAQRLVRVTNLTPATNYTLFVKPTGGALSYPSASVALATLAAPAVPDTTPPSRPNPVSASIQLNSSSKGPSTVTWGASTDNVRVIGYDIYSGDNLVASVSADQTSATAGFFSESPSYPYTVVAVDEAGNVSARSDTATVNTCHIPGLPQFVGAAGGPTVTGTTSTTATLSWTAPADTTCYAVNPAKYAIYRDNGYGTTPTLLDETVQTSIELTGLEPGTTTSVYVFSEGSRGTVGTSASVPVTTKPATTDQSVGYVVKGSATLKNLVKGSLALDGLAHGTLTSAGAFSADLTLSNTTANLKALGFLPVTATVALVPTAPVTGQLTGTTLTATAKVRVKLPSFKVLGIQLAGGANCQASQLSTIPLASTGAFTATGGGNLAGTFSISNLTGCGALNGLVSPLTSGSGNAIALQLTPGGVQ